MRAFAGVAVALLAGGLALGGEPTQLSLAGKVKSAEKDGSRFELSERRGTFKATVDDKTEIRQHRYAAAKDCGGGAAQILARLQPRSTNPQTNQSIAERYIQVIAIVVGDGFHPPPVPPDLAEKKLQWFSGTLRADTTTGVQLGSTDVQCGADRKVVVIEPAEKDALAKAKGRPALVELRVPDPKAKEGVARRVTLLSPEVPAAELRVILPAP